ncbi:MAG: hypothetical protein RPU60_12940 [Candidatus Sedimenticola sp. (ex Thyasira tokunagai)]
MIIPMRGGRKKPSSVVFTGGKGAQGGAPTSYTFSALAMGEASSDRVIIVAASCSDNNAVTITEVSVGGVVATRAEHAQHTNGYGVNNGLWVAPFPVGTTADVVVKTSTGAQSSVAIYAAYGLESVMPYASDPQTANDPLNLSLAGLAETGFALSIASTSYSGTSVIWAGIIEDTDQSANGHTSSSASVSVDGTSLNVSADYASPGGARAGVIAAWK